MRCLLGVMAATWVAAGGSAAGALDLKTIQEELAAHARNPSGAEIQDSDPDYYVFSRCAGLLGALRAVVGDKSKDAGERSSVVFSKAAMIVLIADRMGKGLSRDAATATLSATVAARSNEMTGRYLRQITANGFVDGSVAERDATYCEERLPVAHGLVKEFARRLDRPKTPQ